MKLPLNIKSLFKSSENKYEELPRRLNKRSKSSISKFEIVKRDKFRTTQSIGKWRQAMILAEDIDQPDNSYLMDVYDDVVLDAHLSAVMNVRRMKVTGKEFHIINNISGDVNEDLTNIFQKQWFRDILNVMMDAVFFGTQLFELVMISEDEFKVNVIPKRNFEPQISEFYIDSSQKNDGEDYTDYLHENLFEVTHSSGEFGLVFKACPHALVKKDVMAFWAEYTEIYGMPIRIGKTNIRDKDRAQELSSSLRDMGSSAYAVLDETEELEFLESSKSTNHEIYSKRAEFANSEMSKIILGQTMTTDDGASLSQSEVHERVMSSIEMADLKWIDRWITRVLIPRMRLLGFLNLPEADEFNFDLKQTLDVQAQFDMITSLLDKGYDIPIDYLQEFTGIPIDGKRENPVETQPNSDEIRNYFKKKSSKINK